MRQIQLTTSQLKSVQEYCKLNKIEDVDNFITKCFASGFSIEKYGLLGEDSEKPVEIEIIKEIRVEVPVEVIKEVEKIVEVVKEVPVETIKEVEVIKYVDREVVKEVKVEVPVEKIVYVHDKKEEESVTNLDNICDKPEPIIVEKIVEIIKEVPVEKIVEKIVEVEKPNDKVLLLQETLQTLKKELSSKNSRIEELEEKNKLLESNKLSQGAVYLKGSNLNEMM